ncbi:methyl-accepting chemotaxis protein [Hoeflea marina]|uniref:Methyl-accepting chemotaxis protein n=1 Tax=Hoeflea marina TaxID=274592 RepID=A0A317PCF5_9HYPH|nr:methyl-accepting chemotaxis protein [Hoeflea marina]PWV95738.1 methyl-accepting chemotaxis protein [Hoeflea marina]
MTKKVSTQAAGAGSSISITKKVAIAIVVVNFIGLLVMGLVTSGMSESLQKTTAIRNWSKDTVLIGAQASGGVKWGKVDAIRAAYQVYESDPRLALIGFSAFNKDGVLVDSWARDGDFREQVSGSIAAPAALAGEAAEVSELDGHIHVAAPLPADKDGASLGQIRTVWTTDAISASAMTFAFKSIGFQVAILAVSVALLLFAMSRFVGRPLADINRRIIGLQQGDFDSAVPHAGKGDEVGVIARALTGFCDAAKAKEQADIEMEHQRVQLDSERLSNAESTQGAMRAQQSVVAELGRALEGLASGDLTVRVPDLGADFQKLSDDFNRAIVALSDTVATIDDAQRSVSRSSSDIEQSTDQLARRTEQQAASLEETAAALDQITATVQAASTKAVEAGGLVGSTRKSTEMSSDVVRQAIDAMSRIEQSSIKIAQILNVIDEIAFQTNLLALNAGVEAARAGEAGRGFAVVAQEVRELAGRSANAAKEIKQLIEESDKQVKNGVSLVNRTGEAITLIDTQVIEVSSTIDAISTSAREQAVALSHINTAINQMDVMTQQNAGMVQESHRASQGLGAECQRLSQIVQSFTVASSNAPRPVVATAPVRPAAVATASAATPATRRAAAPRLSVAGNTALAEDSNAWSEF